MDDSASALGLFTASGQQTSLDDSGNFETLNGGILGATFITAPLVQSDDNGTAALPAIGRRTDPNTGIFHPAGDTWAWATAGFERMRIDSSGNVGVGTTSPAAELHVIGEVRATTFNAVGSEYRINGVAFIGSDFNLSVASIATTGDLTAGGRLLADDGGASAPAYSFSSENNLGMFRAGSGSIGLATSGIERFRIDGSGDVGIGTTDPSERLHVSGDLRIDGDIGINAAAVAGVELTISDNFPRFDFIDTNGSDVLWQLDANVMTLQGSGTSILDFAWGVDTGFVGFQDLTPDAQLEVLSIGGETQIILAVSSQTDTTGDIFSILGNGNVGIGTTAPDALFHVSGGTVTINQGALDDSIIGWGSSDIVRSLGLGLDGPSIFASIRKISATSGGALWSGYSDTTDTGAEIRGVIGSANPTDTVPALRLVGTNVSGTGLETMSALETPIQFFNYQTVMGTFLGNGNFGLGTVSPDNTLTVSGDADFTTNVGISTASPNAPLHIKDASDSNTTLPDLSAALLVLQRTNTTAHAPQIALVGGTAAANFGGPSVAFGDTTDRDLGIIAYDVVDDQFQIRVNNNGTASMVIDAAGIGIGLTNPAEALDVVGDIQASVDVHATRNLELATNGSVVNWQTGAGQLKTTAGFIIDLDVDNNGTTSKLQVRKNLTGESIFQVTEDGLSSMGDNTTPTLPFQLRTSSLTVEVGGNVGIGTSNPVPLFHVSHNDTAIMYLEAVAGGSMQIQFLEAATNRGLIGFVGADNAHVNGTIDGDMIAYTALANNAFNIANTGDGLIWTRFDKDQNIIFNPFTQNTTTSTATGELQVGGTGDSWFLGNLGIGTTDPIVKLDVPGSVQISSGTVFINGDDAVPFRIGVTTMVVNSTGDIAFDTNLFYIDSVNNRIGIGTSQPGTLLAVDGGVRLLETGDATNFGDLSIAADYFSFGSFGTAANSGGYKFFVDDSSLNAMQIEPTGDIGIGETAPAARFEIKSTAANAFTLQISSADGSAMYRFDANGHLEIAGADPTLGTCTNGAVNTNSSATAGQITFSGANSSCAVVFAKPMDATPMCLCTAFDAGNNGCEIIAQSATGVTYGPETGSWASGDAINFFCVDMHAE